jgi:hypothetical protein
MAQMTPRMHSALGRAAAEAEDARERRRRGAHLLASWTTRHASPPRWFRGGASSIRYALSSGASYAFSQIRAISNPPGAESRSTVNRELSSRGPDMSRNIARSSLIAAMGIILFLLAAAPAFALYPQLSTKLAGPAIGGIVPSGDAKVDQSRLPTEALTLEARVKSVNLRDGTVLSVVLTDCGSAPVATLTLSRGEAQLRTTVPFCEVGRTSSILIKNGAPVVLSGGSPWQV